MDEIITTAEIDAPPWAVWEPLDDGERTRLTHAETFRGVLVGFVNRRIGDDIETGFERMNEALQARVEDGDADRQQQYAELDGEAER